jgi:diphosphomevalonate decarboxylase
MTEVRSTVGVGHARACANIALAKYWGKSDETLNLPAVPSLSITLDALVTETTVTVDRTLTADVVLFDGTIRDGDDRTRASELLDRIRARSGVQHFARVETVNHFPTASGLASSASGFAALATAAARAYSVDASLEQLSAWARRSSASAARSVFGGFVELPAGIPGDDALCARVVAPADHWDVCIVIALASLQRKKTSSRDGMIDTARTSPYYPAWVEQAPKYFNEVREGVIARDLEKVGVAMEASTFAMHASALAARPAVRYYSSATATLLDTVEALRNEGIAAFSTMDAGPHVKVLCMRSDAEKVREALLASGAAVDVRIARPGPGVQ